jgi:hypothetical protein
VFPREGPDSGGDPVTIELSAPTKNQPIRVWFGSQRAKVLGLDGAKLLVSPPGGKPEQVVDIVVAIGDEKLTVPDAYKYIDPTGGF